MGAIIFVAGFFILAGLTAFTLAMRNGSGTAIKRTEPSRDSRILTIWSVVAVVLGMGIAVPTAVLLVNEDSGARAAPGGKELTASEHEGREMFTDKCATCHTLDDARAVGKVGPDLDVLRPQAGLTVNAIVEGRARGMGQMPRALFNGEDAENVAKYVERVAGR